jgi:hypothetical protein
VLQDLEAYHTEDSQSRLREPPVAVGKYSKSSYQDDDGRMQEERELPLMDQSFKW